MNALVTGVMALLATTPDGVETVDVWRYSQQHPVRLELLAPEAHTVSARGDRLVLDGALIASPLDIDRAVWRCLGRDGSLRRDHSALSVGAHDGELRLVARFPLEEWVARAVASESLPGTPPAALQAQAIVARSYAVAGTARHPESRLCDLAHCTSLAASPSAAHREAAHRAAEATRAWVLRDVHGTIVRALFHRSCGGVTADPQLTFGGVDDTGAVAVAEAECSQQRWRARLSRTRIEQVAARTVGGSVAPVWDRMQLDYGPDGRLARLLDRASGRFTSGDRFVRALDAALGWGVVRSTAFTWRAWGDEIVLEGRGIGHGVGLCQLGAARWAARGDDATTILRRYFPKAVIAALSEASWPRTTHPASQR